MFPRSEILATAAILLGACSPDPLPDDGGPGIDIGDENLGSLSGALFFSTADGKTFPFSDLTRGATFTCTAIVTGEGSVACDGTFNVYDRLQTSLVNVEPQDNYVDNEPELQACNDDPECSIGGDIPLDGTLSYRIDNLYIWHDGYSVCLRLPAGTQHDLEMAFDPLSGCIWERKEFTATLYKGCYHDIALTHDTVVDFNFEATKGGLNSCRLKDRKGS